MSAVEEQKLGARLTKDSELGQMVNHVISLGIDSPISISSVVMPHL